MTEQSTLQTFDTISLNDRIKLSLRKDVNGSKFLDIREVKNDKFTKNGICVSMKDVSGVKEALEHEKLSEPVTFYLASYRTLEVEKKGDSVQLTLSRYEKSPSSITLDQNEVSSLITLFPAVEKLMELKS